MLGLRCTVEVEVSQRAANAARELTADGVATVAAGSAQLGKASVLHEVASAIDDAAQ